MTCEIGRKTALLVGSESTRGTEAGSFVAIPLTSAPFIKPVVEKVRNEAGIGNIADASDSYVAKIMSETNVEGQINEITFGNLLKAVFGQSVSPTLVETGVYSHAFTVLNNNSHASFSLVEDTSKGQKLSLFNLLNNLDFNFAVGDIARFSGTYMGRNYSSTSGKTVSFISEQPFLVSNMTVKFADSVAGLDAATAVGVNSFNFSVAKNVLDITKSGSIDPVGFCNQQLGIAGDMELFYDDNSYRDFVTGNTKKAVRIEIVGNALIGATEYSKLVIDFAQIALDDWDRSTDNNAVLTQTIGLSAEYSISETSMIEATLQNTQSTQY